MGDKTSRATESFFSTDPNSARDLVKIQFSRLLFSHQRPWTRPWLGVLSKIS